MVNLPRGIRNHNPGNIIQNNIIWKGMIKKPFDPKFVEFEAPEWGLRALMKILFTYYERYGLDTVQSIVNRWAPPHENATDHYAGYVSKALKIRRNQKMELQNPKILIALTKAIIRFENGHPKGEGQLFWYEEALYKKALSLV